VANLACTLYSDLLLYRMATANLAKTPETSTRHVRYTDYIQDQKCQGGATRSPITSLLSMFYSSLQCYHSYALEWQKQDGIHLTRRTYALRTHREHHNRE
jgi:hypothetical protein